MSWRSLRNHILNAFNLRWVRLASWQIRHELPLLSIECAVAAFSSDSSVLNPSWVEANIEFAVLEQSSVPHHPLLVLGVIAVFHNDHWASCKVNKCQTHVDVLNLTFLREGPFLIASSFVALIEADRSVNQMPQGIDAKRSLSYASFRLRFRHSELRINVLQIPLEGLTVELTLQSKSIVNAAREKITQTVKLKSNMHELTFQMECSSRGELKRSNIACSHPSRPLNDGKKI